MAISPQEADFLIDRAVRAMRELPVSNGLSADVVEKVRLACATNAPSFSSTPGTLSSFGSRLMRPSNLFAITAAALFIALATQWTASNSNGNCAFAQVQEQVTKTKSVQYVETDKSTSSDNKRGPEVVRHVMILGSSLSRSDITVHDGEKLDKGYHWPLKPDHYINVYDARQGKLITLYPEKKEFIAADTLSPVTDDGKVVTEGLRDTKADLYEEIRRVPMNTAKRISERLIDGKKAIGFATEETTSPKQNLQITKRTYWIDPDTKLPIRIEGSSQFTNADGVLDWVINEIVFDAPLDPKLLGTEPPKGWTDLNAKQSTETNQ
jgi:hypothetical protein